MTPRTRAAYAARVLPFLLVIAACASDGSTSTDLDVAVSAPTALTTTAPVITAEPASQPTALAFDPPPTAVPAPSPPVALITPTAAPTPTTNPDPVAAPTVIADGDVATPVPATEPTSTPTQVTGSQEILAANGGEVYTLNCARCHAENGLGTPQYSATLIGVGSKYSTQGMIAELTSGHPVTFGFADRLTAEEIASVVAYVKATFP